MGRLPDFKTEASVEIELSHGAIELDVWSFGSGRRLLHGRPRGYLTRDDAAKTMTTVVEDPRFGPDLPTLWDFRGHDFSAYSGSEFRSHAFLLPRYPGRAGVRRGYLVDCDTGFGTLRMFQGAASGFNFEQQENLLVSYSLEELVDWLLP